MIKRPVITPLLVVVIGLVLAVGQLVSAETTAPTNSITVNTNLDNASNDGLCSLREAIANVNADAQVSADCASGDDAHTIVFSFSTTPTTITLNPILGGFDIADYMIIDGSGANLTIIPTSASASLFNLQSIGLFTIRGFTIANADTMANGSVFNIETYRYLKVDQMTFRNNKADRGGVFSIVANDYEVEITNSIFDGNSASYGSAIRIENYESESDQGRNFDIRNSTFINHINGAIYSEDKQFALIIDNSVFENNSSTGDGGAIDVGNTIRITNSTFADNHAERGGALDVVGVLKITNSTFSENHAGSGGGAIRVWNFDNFQKTTLTHVTFWDNVADNGNGQAVLFRDNPAGIEMTANIMVKGLGLGVVGPSCWQSSGNDVSNEITSFGGNIVDGCGGDLTATGDQQLTALDLPALANNSGQPAPNTPPRTHAILIGSPPHNAKDSCSIDEDQRGVGRSMIHCDAGAYEFGRVTTAVQMKGMEVSADLSGSGHPKTPQHGLLFILTTTLLLITSRKLAKRDPT